MLYSIHISSCPKYCSKSPDNTNVKRPRRFLQPFLIFIRTFSNQSSERESKQHFLNFVIFIDKNKISLKVSSDI